MKKALVIIGLGKMGQNLSLRLKERGWKVWGLDKGYDFSKIKKLSRPRVLLLSVPAAAVDEAISDSLKFLDKGDIIADFGNSFYKDSIRRAKFLAKKGIRFVDVGISGGPGGARRGASLMVGGRKRNYEYLRPLFLALARGPKALAFFEGAGNGHFVKMVHNGIEYGMMQALAEGFTLLKKRKINLIKAALVYSQGSVIESRLVGWLQDALRAYGEEFKGVSGTIGHTGEGAWTVKVAKELGVPVKVIEDSLKFRIQSAKNPSWTGKLLTALRGQFGGHAIRNKKRYN